MTRGFVFFAACSLSPLVWSSQTLEGLAEGHSNLQALAQSAWKERAPAPPVGGIELAQTAQEPRGIVPGKTYNFASLRQALKTSPVPVKDAEEALAFIPLAVQNKLDAWGVKITYADSFFKPDPNCRVGGTYMAFFQKIDVRCPASISILVAEGAHAVDHFLGGGWMGFRTNKDPKFKTLHQAYKTRVDAHARKHGHSGYKEHKEKAHAGRWSFLPGPLDDDPILGKQGYDMGVELYMEGFIYHYYNRAKLARQAADLAKYVADSIEEAGTAARKFSPQGLSPDDIIVDPVW